MTLGYLYMNDGQEDKAVAIYEQALKAMPNLWSAANNLAYMLSKEGNGKGDLERAHELALKAVKLQPEQAHVIDTLGWVHYQRGETDMAIAELEKAIERAPESAIINYHMGMALMKANRLDEAREMLERAVSQEDFPEREAAKRALKTL
jgi:tetratricopeptide (TPR) repeat protein